MQFKAILKKFHLKGYCEIKNFISKNELTSLKKFVYLNLKKNNGKTFFLSSKSNNEVSKFFKNNKTLKKKIQSFLYKLSEKSNIKDYKKRDIYMVLRVIKNERIQKESYQFHFDAHLFTILVPIFIPKTKNSNNGHLFISPNLRKINKSIIVNIFQKIIYQNLLKKLFGYKKLIKTLNFKKIILKPGSIFLFNGFRNLHGNADIAKNDLRATLLIHFYDVFEKSKLVKLNREIRIWSENKRIKKNIND